MVIVRENTEGLYCQNGGFLYKNTPHEVANQIEVTTRHGVERCIRYAFEYAKVSTAKKVTLVAKTNVLRFAHNLWQRAFDAVAAEYPEIKTDYHHVDACCMYMVTKPQIYDVIVTTNMFGDIIRILERHPGRHGHGRQRESESDPKNRQHVRARAWQRAGHRGQGFCQPHRHIFVGGDDAWIFLDQKPAARRSTRRVKPSSPTRKITREIRWNSFHQPDGRCGVREPVASAVSPMLPNTDSLMYAFLRRIWDTSRGTYGTRATETQERQWDEHRQHDCGNPDRVSGGDLHRGSSAVDSIKGIVPADDNNGNSDKDDVGSEHCFPGPNRRPCRSRPPRSPGTWFGSGGICLLFDSV